MKNNLFYYATKELSQDAFICWLCSYAGEGTASKDTALTECAEHLLCEFIGADKGSVLSEIEIRKQYKNIDVLILLKCQGEQYAVIVEDKTHSSEHDDQLDRYRNTVSAMFPDYKLVCVYYKTGFQSDYSKVEKSGYKIFGRKKNLEILGEYVNRTDNDIFKDYYAYWENYEEITGSYRDIEISKWDDGRQVNVFYEYVQDELTNKNQYWTGYGWVNNRSGGFWGLWYGIDDDHIIDEGVEATLYLQVEIQWDYDNNKYAVNICLKLERKDADDNIFALRDKLFGMMGEYGFNKPRNVRTATHMTVGIYDAAYTTYIDLMDAIKEAAKKYTKLIGVFRSI